MRFFLLFLLFSLTLSNFGLSQANLLKIGNPHIGNWTYTYGNIEDAAVTVEPHGLYMEYGLYLTFSAIPYSFYNGDSLEVVLKFTLPEKSAIIDSWLWIDDNISKALLLDSRTATEIYENNVRRRIDPSLLRKTGTDTYELRIFPLIAGNSRRVKITYLAPNTWNGQSVWASLPTHVVATSHQTPQEFLVRYYPKGSWKTPLLQASQSINFTPVIDSTGNNLLQATIPNSLIDENISIQFASPITNGVYAEKYETADDKFYEIAFSPEAFLNQSSGRKVCVLLDYESGGQLNREQMLSEAKIALLNNLSPADSFNLFFSEYLNIQQTSSGWISAHPDSIKKAFDDINYFSVYSSLNGLIAAGIEFMQQQGNDGNVLLISNARQYSNFSVATAVYNDVIGLMSSIFPINIVDYNTLNNPYTILNSVYYFGNEYLYRRLAEYTGGGYQSIHNNSQTLGQALNKALEAASGPNITAFDLTTTVTGGFCYGRYSISSEGSLLSTLKKPITQIGRYFGNLPMKVQFGCIIDNQPYFAEVLLEENDFVSGDTMMREKWYTQYIKDLELSSSNNAIVPNLVSTSINERILSTYTAFLCLEDSIYFCPTCPDDGGVIIDTQEPKDGGLALKAFPNPFTDEVNFTAETLGNPGSLEIYTMDGRLVYQKTIASGDAAFNWTWNGNDTGGAKVAPGVYFVRIQSGGKQTIIKLIRI